MEWKEFNIGFDFENQKYNGTCTVYHEPGATEFPYKFRLYRVALNTHKVKPYIALFYEVNKEKQRFYWFEPPESRDKRMWIAIAGELEKHQ